MQTDVALNAFSTLRIGGCARYFVNTADESVIIDSYEWAKKNGIEIFCLGRGSNCLFADSGFDGLVLRNRSSNITIDDSLVSVSAGVFLPSLSLKTAKKHLSGLEFGIAVPASVGGALWMNAGASNCEIKDHLRSVTFFDGSDIQTVYPDPSQFSYRASFLQECNVSILSCTFLLKKDLLSQEHLKEILLKRRKTQPLGMRSCGSVFKNPSKNLSAAYLIDKSGLKGLEYKDIQISHQHANFFVNSGNAKARDMVDLMKKVQDIVYSKYDIVLEKEVIVVGKI